MGRYLTKRIILGIIFGLLAFYLTQRISYLWIISSGTHASRIMYVMERWLKPGLANTASPYHYGLVAFGIVFVLTLITGTLLSGYKSRKGEEHGSARWGTRADIKPFMSKDPDRNILLSATEGITMDRVKSYEYDRNKNVLVVGGPGSGKSRNYVVPNLMQLHSSYVITDPKGTILPQVGHMMENNDYDVLTFNTINLSKSMHYNPLAYIYKESDILKVVNVLIKNTEGEGEKKNEDFWVKSERLLYTALIAYLYQDQPDELNIPSMLKLLRLADVREEDESYKNELDVLFEELEKTDPQSFAVAQYKLYKKAAGKTAKSILISCGARLAPFDIPEVREIVSYDELGLDRLGDKKTALFIIMSDTDSSYSFLIAMLMYQLFNVLCTKADDEYGGSLPVHIRCLLDEFANIGKIPDFDKLITTIRSRNISASLILQSITQLDRDYGKGAEIIIDGCDTFIFLGGKGLKTTENVSKLIGKQTIQSQSSGQSRGQSSSSSINQQVIGRDLIDPAEVAKLKKGQCLVMIYGIPPFKSNKINLKKHKRYNQISDGDNDVPKYRIEDRNMMYLKKWYKDIITEYKIEGDKE